MAARKPIMKTIEVDGVNVKLDSSFLESWDGVMMAVDMQRLAEDDEATEGSKVAAVVEYYRRAVPNLDEVAEALGGGGVSASKVFETLGKAIQKASGKN